MKKFWAIVKFDRNYWHYWTTEGTWSAFIPRARKFASSQEADLFLMMQKDWDGYFQVIQISENAK